MHGERGDTGESTFWPHRHVRLPADEQSTLVRVCKHAKMPMIMCEHSALGKQCRSCHVPARAQAGTCCQHRASTSADFLGAQAGSLLRRPHAAQASREYVRGSLGSLPFAPGATLAAGCGRLLSAELSPFLLGALPASVAETSCLGSYIPIPVLGCDQVRKDSYKDRLHLRR